MKENKHIVNKAKEQVTFKNNFTVKKWERIYNMLEEYQKTALFAKLELLQSQYIKDSMLDMKKEIPLPRIGKLSIKPNRLKFYQLREQYPEKSISEIREIIIQEHIQEKRKQRAEGNQKKIVKELHFKK